MVIQGNAGSRVLKNNSSVKVFGLPSIFYFKLQLLAQTQGPSNTKSYCSFQSFLKETSTDLFCKCSVVIFLWKQMKTYCNQNLRLAT